MLISSIIDALTLFQFFVVSLLASSVLKVAHQCRGAPLTLCLGSAWDLLSIEWAVLFMVHHLAPSPCIWFNSWAAVSTLRVYWTCRRSTRSCHRFRILVINWWFSSFVWNFNNCSNCRKLRFWHLTRIIIYFSSTYSVFHRWTACFIGFSIIKKVVAVWFIKTFCKTQTCVWILSQRMWRRSSCIALSITATIPSGATWGHVAHHGYRFTVFRVLSL
jgi:hypothetical protein